MAGLVWQGRAHCGLDDAKNTARLLSLLMGVRFSITNSLTWHETEHLPPPKQISRTSQEALGSKDPLPHPKCFCGVKCNQGLIRKPGLKQGSSFFRCGNWSVAQGAGCHYFDRASLPESLKSSKETKANREEWKRPLKLMEAGDIPMHRMGKNSNMCIVGICYLLVSVERHMIRTADFCLLEDDRSSWN